MTRRLIPAHAGKTRSVSRRPPSRRAHPRSRGENDDTGGETRVVPGSSPLTRGKQLGVEGGGLLVGLIPAHAGKTPLTWTPPTWTTAHPRSRGENPDAPGIASANWGSSPLTRGKRGAGGQRRDRQGLIPAHAGKTVGANGLMNDPRAHPRSRGENGSTITASMGGAGSSPLTRGKLRKDQPNERTRGLIPAHAGKTARRAGTP